MQPFMFMSLPVGGFSLSLVEGRGGHLPSHVCYHLNGVHSNRHAEGMQMVRRFAEKEMDESSDC